MKTEHLRQKLEEEKAKLESEMLGIGQRNLAVPGDWESLPSEIGAEPNIIDQADVLVSRENTSAIFADIEARYDTILSALARIEKGTYGKCEVCGVTISEDRLTANPSATTCVEHL